MSTENTVKAEHISTDILAVRLIPSKFIWILKSCWGVHNVSTENDRNFTRNEIVPSKESFSEPEVVLEYYVVLDVIFDKFQIF